LETTLLTSHVRTYIKSTTTLNRLRHNALTLRSPVLLLIDYGISLDSTQATHFSFILSKNYCKKIQRFSSLSINVSFN